MTTVKFEEAVVAEPLLRTIRELWELFELKLNTSSEPGISTEPKRLLERVTSNEFRLSTKIYKTTSLFKNECFDLALMR